MDEDIDRILKEAMKDQNVMMIKLGGIEDDSMQLIEAIIQERSKRIEAENKLQELENGIEALGFLTNMTIQENQIKLSSIKTVAINAMDGELNYREAFNYIVDIINTEVNKA